MYRIVICDDEKEILNDLYQKIQGSFQGNGISADYTCFSDARVLMEHLQTQRIDVLFLDIDMPYHNGMDIAGYINSQKLPAILIFVTSHDALVYQTFAYRPFGFIRKSHLEEELDHLTKRVIRELSENQQELIFQKGSELCRILLNDIIYIEGEGNYLALQLKNDRLRIRETITNLENKLMDKGFIRCHKGYLANTRHIAKLKSAELLLQWGDETVSLPIGRSYEKEVREKILAAFRN